MHCLSWIRVCTGQRSETITEPNLIQELLPIWVCIPLMLTPNWMLSIEHKTFLFQFHFHQVKGSQSIFLWIMALPLLLDLPVQMLLCQLLQLVILWPVHPQDLSGCGKTLVVSTTCEYQEIRWISRYWGIFQKAGDFLRKVCLPPVCAPDGDPWGRCQCRVQEEHRQMQRCWEGSFAHPSESLRRCPTFLGLYHCTWCGLLIRESEPHCFTKCGRESLQI